MDPACAISPADWLSFQRCRRQWDFAARPRRNLEPRTAQPDLDPVILNALDAQPPDLSPSQAVRRAYQAAMASMSDDQQEFENTRQRLMFSIPELKAAMYDEYYRTITTFAEAVGRRIGRDPSDFELRVFAGALAGAMMAVYEPGPRATATVIRALDFVDAGMPLT